MRDSRGLRREWLLAAALVLTILCGCKTAPKPTVVESGTAAKASQPPALAVESFQAAWEIIRDTHFDTNFNGLNWEAVHAKFLPRVQATRSQDEVRDLLQEMIDGLGHSHLMIIPGSLQVKASTEVASTNLTNITRVPSSTTKEPTSPTRPRLAGTGSIGVEVRVVGEQLVVLRVEPGSPAGERGIRPGAVILAIDGEPALDESLKQLGERQREFLNWHRALELLRGPIGDDCVLDIDAGQGKRRMAIPRARESGEPAQLGNLPVMYTRVATNDFTTDHGRRVGYLRFNLWMMPAVPVVDRFIDAHRNADGIVIDMRGNLGGIGGMVMGVSGHFVNERASLGKMKLRDNELNFIAFPRRVDSQMHPTNTFQGKLAILTDAISLSSAELFAGGMQELGRARVFGQKTGGQALPAVSDRLPNGDLLYHAVADFTTPKGRRLEENGVVPDEIVPLRIEALRAGKDEPLAKALEWMDR